MRRSLAVLFLLLLTACGATVAAEGHGGPTTTYKPHETTTTTYKSHETTTTYPQHVTTTTKPPHETTTTYPHQTTTTKPAHETTTTSPGPTTTKPPHETTTTAAATTTTSHATTTTTGGGGGTTTTAPPKPGLFSVQSSVICADGAPVIQITFGNRPDLDGQTGELQIKLATSGRIIDNQLLTFQSGQTVTIPYPDTNQAVTLTYMLNGEQVVNTVGPPPTNCAVTTTTGAPTSTTITPTTTAPSLPTTTTSSLQPTTTTTATPPPSAPTTLPETFQFAGAATVCIAEVPTIEIVFQNLFPQLAGRTGTLTMSDINGNVVSVQPLVYQPGATVHILYPGTRVNPDGSIADVPGWNLNADGFWVRDPSDAFLREGIHLHYEVNPSADAFVTYPPESSGCANPTGPFPPGATTTTVPGAPTPTGSLPHTGANENWTAGMAALVLAAGSSLLFIARRRRS